MLELQHLYLTVHSCCIAKIHNQDVQNQHCQTVCTQACQEFEPGPFNYYPGMPLLHTITTQNLDVTMNSIRACDERTSSTAAAARPAPAARQAPPPDERTPSTAAPGRPLRRTQPHSSIHSSIPCPLWGTHLQPLPISLRP
jgi:hypothetical protein